MAIFNNPVTLFTCMMLLVTSIYCNLIPKADLDRAWHESCKSYCAKHHQSTTSEPKNEVSTLKNLTRTVVNGRPHLEDRQDKVEALLEKIAVNVFNSTFIMSQMASTLSKVASTDSKMASPVSDKASYTYSTQDCEDIAAAGKTVSGPYTINPQDGLESFSVYCELGTNRTGWTVFQRRYDGSLNFDRDLEDYEKGFGKTNGEYWLGLRNIYRLTRSGRWTLMVDIETTAGDKMYAFYDNFKISGASSGSSGFSFGGVKYNIGFSDYIGTAGDALRYVNSKMFYAKDTSGCAGQYGAWWYSDSNFCNANLNSDYKIGMSWGNFQSLKSSQMKIRRT